MKAWTATQACRSRAHCASCLDGKWHKLDACPFGVTVAPSPQLDAALQAQARGEVYAPPGRCKGCGN